MAGKFPLRENVPKQTNELPTPPTPHADQEASSTGSTRTETRREKRRREWQENKIRQSREKKQHNQAPTYDEKVGLRVPRTAGPEPQRALEHDHTGTISGGRRHPSHGRTENQWIVIEELKLCAGCLTRTTPPHKPGDLHAPCTGQPNAAFDGAKISMIRKALEQLKAEIRHNDDLGRTGIRSLQRNRQWHPGDTSSTGSQHTLYSGIESRHPHADAGHSEYASGTSRPTHEIHVMPGGSHPFAPLYNLHASNSFLQRSFGTATPSQGTAAQEENPDKPLSDVHLNVSCVTEAVPLQAETTRNRSLELLAGIAPPTPLISGLPGFLIEEELGPIEEHTQLVALIPDCESSSDVPRVKVEDWDTKTKVPEGPQEGFTLSKVPIEKKLLHFYDRSWTMQGLCSPPVRYLHPLIFRSIAEMI
jgi:hypothetical protein